MIPWFQFTTVYIGPIPIQVWGFFVALGIGTSLWLLYKRAKKSGLDAEYMLDMGLWAVIVGLLGARLFHVFIYEPALYLADPIRIFQVWHGGLSSYGGFVGGLVGFLWFAKRKKLAKKMWLKYGDAIARVAVLGWIIARVGCFMIHDHMGKPCDCFLSIQTPDGPRLEMAFLEIIVLLPLLFLFYKLRNTKKPDGWFLGVMSMYYGAARFILDFGRATDIVGADVRYAGLTPAQYFSIILFVVGAYMLNKIRLQKK